MPTSDRCKNILLNGLGAIKKVSVINRKNANLTTVKGKYKFNLIIKKLEKSRIKSAL